MSIKNRKAETLQEAKDAIMDRGASTKILIFLLVFMISFSAKVHAFDHSGQDIEPTGLQAKAFEKADRADAGSTHILLAQASNGGYTDPFSGTQLRNDWSIINEDLERYIIEDGGLFLIADDADTVNFFQLATSLPGGDWEMSAHIFPNFSTGAEGFSVELRDDSSGTNRLAAYVQTNSGQCSLFTLGIHKRGSPNKSFTKNIWEGGTCVFNYPASDKSYWKGLKELEDKGGTLKLHKRGRKYYASFESPALPGGRVFTEDLSILRQSGLPTFLLYQYRDVTGDSSVVVDEFRITPQN